MSWLYVAAFSVSGVSVAFLLLSTPSVSGTDNSAAFSPKSIDLGELAQEAEYPIRLVLTNNSRDSLTVESLTTTCHCTGVTSIEKGTELGGGQSLDLLASFSTGSAEGLVSSKIVAELKRKGQTIYTEAVVEGRVVPEYQITPRELELTLFEGDDFASGVF